VTTADFGYPGLTLWFSWLFNLLALSLPYVGYYRNASCALILKIYVFINITDSMFIKHRCVNYGYSLKTCEINPVKDDFNILSMVVKRKLSRSMCTRAVSYGFYTKSIWVNRGCRADFSVYFQVFESK